LHLSGELSDLARIRITVFRQEQVRSEQMVRLETGLLLLKFHQALDHQSRSDQQRDRECHFGHCQQPPAILHP